MTTQPLSPIFEYRTRPGSLGLSLVAVGGLSVLAAAIWPVTPGFVILALIPALLISFYQIVMSPVYGLTLSSDKWQVLSDRADQSFATDKIAQLHLTRHAGQLHGQLVMRDGTKVALPDAALPEDTDPLIAAAQARGIVVRTG